jgi:NitT/TauT family transport system substrate-binding protein
MRVSSLVLSGAALLLPAAAQAHEGHAHDGLLAGLMHPVGGIDHLLVTLGLGLVAGLAAARASAGAPGGGGPAARTALAKVSGTDLAGYDAQLKTTRLFANPADAVAFTQSPDVQKTMVNVAKFSFDHGLLGEGADSADFIGIGYPGGAVTGSKENVKLRFDDTYMKMAAEQKL